MVKHALTFILCFLLLGLISSATITIPIPSTVLNNYPSLLKRHYQFKVHQLTSPETFLLQSQAFIALQQTKALPSSETVCPALQTSITTINENTPIIRINALIDLVGLYNCSSIHLTEKHHQIFEDLVSSDILEQVHSGVKAITTLSQTLQKFPYALSRYDFVDVLDLTTSLFLADGTTRAAVSVLSPSFRSTTFAFEILSALLSPNLKISEGTLAEFRPYIVQFRKQLEYAQQHLFTSISASLADHASFVVALQHLNKHTSPSFPFDFTELTNALSTSYGSNQFDVVSYLSIITSTLAKTSKNPIHTPIAVSFPSYLTTVNPKLTHLPLHLTTITGGAIPSSISGNCTVVITSPQSGKSVYNTTVAISPTAITIDAPSSIANGVYDVSFDIKVNDHPSTTSIFKSTHYKSSIVVTHSHPPYSRKVILPSSESYHNPQLTYTTVLTSPPKTTFDHTRPIANEIDIATSREMVFSLTPSKTHVVNVRLTPCPSHLSIQQCYTQASTILQDTHHHHILTYFPRTSSPGSVSQLSLRSTPFATAYTTSPLMLVAVDITNTDEGQPILYTTSSYYVGMIHFINSKPDEVNIQQYLLQNTKFPEDKHHTFQKNHSLPSPILTLFFSCIAILVFIITIYAALKIWKPTWDTSLVGGITLAIPFCITLISVIVVLLQYWVNYNLFQIIHVLVLSIVIFVFIAHRVLSSSSRHSNLTTQIHLTQTPQEVNEKKNM